MAGVLGARSQQSYHGMSLVLVPFSHSVRRGTCILCNYFYLVHLVFFFDIESVAVNSLRIFSQNVLASPVSCPTLPR